jgi:hypothetical protein
MTIASLFERARLPSLQRIAATLLFRQKIAIIVLSRVSFRIDLFHNTCIPDRPS